MRVVGHLKTPGDLTSPSRPALLLSPEQDQRVCSAGGSSTSQMRQGAVRALGSQPPTLRQSAIGPKLTKPPLMKMAH